MGGWAGRPLLLVCLFFFFQAEDGIRDIGVTGVQTCALPISGRRGARDRGAARRVALWRRDRAAAVVPAGVVRRAARVDGGRVRQGGRAGAQTRSEERRVGKECRSRWSACRSKRNKG